MKFNTTQRNKAHHAHSLVHAYCPEDNDIRQRAFIAAMHAMHVGNDPARAVRKVVKGE